MILVTLTDTSIVYNKRHTRLREHFRTTNSGSLKHCRSAQSSARYHNKLASTHSDFTCAAVECRVGPEDDTRRTPVFDSNAYNLRLN